MEIYPELSAPVAGLLKGLGWIFFCGLLGLLATPAGAGEGSAAQSQVRVLILTGANNHDWKSTTPVLQKMFGENPRFTVAGVLDDPSRLTTETLARCDVIVSNWSAYPAVTGHQWGAAGEAAFVNFIKAGGGFVVFHAASATCQDWPEFQQLVGRTWGLNHTAHGAYHIFKVSFVDHEHPITRGLPDFWTTDELWHNMADLSPADFHVLANAFSMKEQGGTGKDEPIVLTTQLGQGRGVNIALGHDARAMQTPGWQTLMLRAAEWAATGEVTQPAPKAPFSTPADVASAGLKAEDVIARARNWKAGESRQPLYELEQMVISVAGLTCDDYIPGQTDDYCLLPRRNLAMLLAAQLGTDATPDAKQFFCKQLARIGTKAEIPALVTLLSDPGLSTVARDALARIPGPEAGQALREALIKSEGDYKIGVMNSLGDRRDAQAFAPLAALLATSDTTQSAYASAAADNLGKIGNPSAGEALLAALKTAPPERRPSLAEACLTCAERMMAFDDRSTTPDQSAVPDKANAQDKINTAHKPDAHKVYLEVYDLNISPTTRAAALRGLALTEDGPARQTRLREALTSLDVATFETGLQLVRELPDLPIDAPFIAMADGLTTPAQATLLVALADRGDLAARPVALTAIARPDAAVRAAALVALGRLGQAGDLDPLAVHLADPSPEVCAAAQRGIESLKGPGVNPALAKRMMSDRNPATKSTCIQLLVTRHAVDSVPPLIGETQTTGTAVRREAWKALRELASPTDLPALLDALQKAAAEERDAAESAVAATARRAPDLAPSLTLIRSRLSANPVPDLRASLVRVLGIMGDDRALPELRAALQSADAPVRDAAVRALAGWPAPAVMADLLAIARADQVEAHRVLALQGAARLLGADPNLPEAEAYKIIDECLKLATRPDEKRALLTELGKRPNLDSLRAARALLDDPQLTEEASLVIVPLATQLAGQYRQELREPLKAVLERTSSLALLDTAGTLLKRVSRPANLALDATASSPDGLESDGAASGDAAGIDGNPATYWDETDKQPLYRYRVTFKQPTEVSAISIVGHAWHSFCPKDFSILCDDKAVQQITNAEYDQATNEFFTRFPQTRCTSLELAITGSYGDSPAIRELEIYNLAPGEPLTGQASTTQTAALRWTHGENALALVNHGQPIWAFHWGKAAPKPYFHPLALPNGMELTTLSPADHPWHRGLWFSWKMIDGVNYWEEDRTTGLPEGRTEVLEAKAEPRDDHSASITLRLAYHPAGRPPVLTEERHITVGAPDASGAYTIDWTGVFTAGAHDVVLKGGEAGGGYAGLSARINPLTTQWRIENSEGLSDQPTDDTPGNLGGLAANTHGQRARWADFSMIDRATSQTAGLAIFDHPANPRHPAQWHNILAARGGFGYFSPAPLWSEPLTLPAGQVLTLRYRVLIHPGRPDQPAVDRAWQSWAGSPQ